MAFKRYMNRTGPGLDRKIDALQSKTDKAQTTIETVGGQVIVLENIVKRQSKTIDTLRRQTAASGLQTFLIGTLAVSAATIALLEFKSYQDHQEQIALMYETQEITEYLHRQDIDLSLTNQNEIKAASCELAGQAWLSDDGVACRRDLQHRYPASPLGKIYQAVQKNSQAIKALEDSRSYEMKASVRPRKRSRTPISKIPLKTSYKH